MSIWSSNYQPIGSCPDEETTIGDVRSYASGFSNHYPDKSLEQNSFIDLADIVPWCVPGHVEDENTDYSAVGPWLRLGLYSWAHDYDNPKNPPQEKADLSVVLNEEAVAALVKELQEWLDKPKVYPIPTSQI